MKERFLGLPQVTIPETNDDFSKDIDSFMIDIKLISHFERTKGLFKIVYFDGDEYTIIYSDFQRNIILAYLFELKLLRLINYWNKDK